MNPWIAVVVCLSIPAAVQDKAEEQEFLRMRYEKRILDLSQAHVLFVDDAKKLAELPKGIETLVKVIDYFKKKKEEKNSTISVKGTCHQRWKVCLAIIAKSKNGLSIPDSLVDDYVLLLKAAAVPKSLGVETEVIDFMGKLGVRAKSALPVLREISNGTNDSAAVAAFRAIKLIEKK